MTKFYDYVRANKTKTAKVIGSDKKIKFKKGEIFRAWMQREFLELENGDQIVADEVYEDVTIDELYKFLISLGVDIQTTP